MIGTSFNQYRITATLGTGGMGEVFRARDTRLNREVAIKVLPKDFAADADRLRRFDQESQTLAALNHPNILTIHDAGVNDGTPYLVSELLDGRTLRDELSGGALSLRKATGYALQIAQGLGAAHSKGIIHRDLKPENIFVTKESRVKILDFGLAKLQSELKSEIPKSAPPADPNAATMVQSTEAGRILGTPAYMSPEQVRGESVDHRTDIFAFGCVLYEMLCGARAFRRDTPIESMHAVLKEEPPALTERSDHFPPALERIVQRCLDKQPENRFQTAKDLAFALGEISASELARASGPRFAGGGGRVTTRKLVLPAAAIIVLGAVAVWQPWRKTPPSSRTAQPTMPASTPADSARSPLQGAREAEAKGFDASLDELNLAISLCQRQVEQNPADAEAWALLCRLHCNDYFNFDHTPERFKAAQAAARSALSLAPESISAGLAQACVYTLEQATYTRGLDMLRRLEQQAPREPDVLKTLAWSILNGPQEAAEARGIAEAIELYRRALKLRPNDAMALTGQAWALAFAGRHDEADAVWDASIRRTGSAWSLVGKFYDLANNRNKPEEAKALLERFPPDLLFNSMVVRVVTQFWLTQHQPQKALAFIEPFPGEFLEDHWDQVPKRYLVGRAHAQAGQMAAAQLEWRQALNAVNAKLAIQAENAHLIAYKARLLSLLGEPEEAARQVELYGQLTPSRSNQGGLLEKMMLNLDVGRAKEAVLLIENNRPILTPNQSDLLFVRNRLRRDMDSHPEFGSVPEFRDELAKLEAEAQLAEKSGPSTNTAPGATVSGNSVAVLPFVNLSSDKADEYLSDGMTEELLNALSRVEGLRVPGRSSSFAFKGKSEEDLYRKLGDQLHVGAVLEGSLRKAGSQLRVTARLIKVADGFPIWSEEYDRDMTNIFAIQSDIATRVATALKVKLLGLAAQSPTPTQNIEAYKLYLQGRQRWNRRTGESLAQAIRYFNQATALDPAYALAYSGLADCYAILDDYSAVPASDTVPKARASALKAIELDASLGEPHAALGKTKADFDWDWSGAEVEFRRAIQLNPTYATAHHWFGEGLEAQGRLSEAVAEYQQAQDLDPLSPVINQTLAEALFQSGKESLAIQMLQKQITLDPNFPGAHEALGNCLVWRGKLSEAIPELEKAHHLYVNASGWGFCGFAYARGGRTMDARHLLDQLLQFEEHSNNVIMEVALVQHGLGDDTRALDALEKAAQERAISLSQLNSSPFWKDLRPHPRAQAILRKMHLIE